MTDKELIDRYLTGELDPDARAQLEAELAAHPELLRELQVQQEIEQALRVLLGDDTADQQVTVSVLGVIRGKSLDQFKSDLMKRVRDEGLRKQKEEQAIRTLPRVPASPAASPSSPASPTPRPPSEKVSVRPLPEPSLPRARWTRVFLASAAAVALLGAGLVLLLRRPLESETGKSRAFVLTASPDARVQRGGSSFALRAEMALEAGDRLTTAENGSVKIGFADDPTRLELKGLAQLHLVAGGKSKRFELLKGELEASVAPQTEGDPLSVTTLQAELRVRDARLRLLAAADFSRLEVRKGTVRFARRSDRKEIEVPADHFAISGKDAEFVAQALGTGAPSGPGSGAAATLVRAQGDVYLFTQSPAERLPVKVGQPLLEDQGLVTEGAKSLAVVEYPDSTRLEARGDTVVRRFFDSKEKLRKRVILESGVLLADVAKQPSGRPMVLATALAEAMVVGTRFTLTGERDSTRLQVEEGAVQFTQTQDRMTVVVRSGYYAVAAPGRPFEAVAVPGGVRYLDIDLGSGAPDGDGEWTNEPRTVRQRKVSRLPDGPGRSPVSNLRFPVEEKEGVLLESTVEVDQVTPDVSMGLGAWGFGLSAAFQNQTVVLRSLQGAESGSTFEFKDVKAIPFEHGREGLYRLKLRLERRAGARALVRGKIWQGDREPDGWMIEDELPLEGPMSQVGFQTVRCACTFSSFRVQVLKDEPR
jgi:ferric-dicitrate binding protein FerR (iron transport regulator)